MPLPTDTSIVYVPRDEFDAVCARFHLTPEWVFEEGYIQATFRKTTLYRTATEESPHA
jgi:hypothetical protein